MYMIRSTSRLVHAPRRWRSHRYFAATPALVKVLRERTGAPMMECKKALDDGTVNGDVEKAVDWLRAKGIARATNQATTSRVATEGLIGMKRVTVNNEEIVTLVEVNSETDFVARNKEFQQFVVDIVHAASSMAVKNQVIPVEDILKLPTKSLMSSENSANTITVQESLGEAVSKIRENLVIRRAINISTAAGPGDGSSVIGAYMHGKVITPFTTDIQLGRSAGVVELKAKPSISENLSVIADPARKLAMHVVAAKPIYISVKDVPSDVLEKEKAIFREQSENDPKKAKSPEILEKMIMGKVNKRLSEITLLEQTHFAEEGAPVIRKHLEDVSKLYGKGSSANISLSRFYLWSIGPSN